MGGALAAIIILGLIIWVRKRVYVFLDRHLIHHLIFHELIADILLYRLFILTYRVYVVATAPEVPTAKLVFEICMPVEYH